MIDPNGGWGGARERNGWGRMGGPADSSETASTAAAGMASAPPPLAGAPGGAARVSSCDGAATRPAPAVEERMTRCLVVDDDAEIRNSLQDYLQKFGVTVST
ncbi:MAG: hypothetical protein ABW220_16650, partial [Burkholderiaceae bacterium]